MLEKSRYNLINRINGRLSNKNIKNISDKKKKSVGLRIQDYLKKIFDRESQYLKQVEAYIRKKLSIENVINNLNEIDKIKFSLFSEEEILIMRFLEKPLVQKADSESYMQYCWTHLTQDAELTDSSKQKILSFLENSNNNSKLNKLLNLR
jgi:hypothetical protein